MANRILRDTTDSEKINRLSPNAEVLFYRLIMKADDFGSFYANPKMIKSLLFPLKDSIRSTDITQWIAECVKSGLIVVYKSGHKEFLRIVNFGQRLRNMRNKFPDPPRIAAMRRESPPEGETETEIETESEGETEGEKKFSPNENFLIPAMLIEWKKIYPAYPEEKKKDFPALREIAEFIAEKQKIPCNLSIMPLFIQLIEFTSTHDFFKKCSISQVSQQIQGIIMTIQNEKSNRKTSNGRNSPDLRQQVNEAFAKRHPRAPA